MEIVQFQTLGCSDPCRAGLLVFPLTHVFVSSHNSSLTLPKATSIPRSIDPAADLVPSLLFAINQGTSFYTAYENDAVQPKAAVHAARQSG